MAENISSNSFQWWIGTESERIAYTPVFGTYGIRWWATDSLQLYTWDAILGAWVQIGDNSGLTRILPTYQFLPGLVAVWPMTSVSGTTVYDFSQQNRALTTAAAAPTFPNSSPPYSDYVLASSQYMSRASETALNTFANGLTIYNWVWFDAPSTGVDTGIVGKYYTTAPQRGYLLWKSSANSLSFGVSGTGLNLFSITDVAANYTTGRWFFLVGRFTPSTEVALFVDTNKYTNVTTIPATIFASTEALEFGRYNRANYLDGRISITAIYGYPHSDAVISNVWQQTRRRFGL